MRWPFAVAVLSLVPPALAQEPIVLPELEVTAQRRPENVVDVPISVQVLSPEELAARSQTRQEEAISAVPNAQMGTTTGSLYTNFTALRGVGSALIDADPAVGLYVDGIAQGASQGYGGNLLDVQRIEVLRGPQGTLYGRNNLAGSINIISTLPDPARLGGKAGLEFGSRNTIRGYGILNMPLGTRGWAVRGAFSGSRTDGYTDNVATGQPLNGLQDLHGRISLQGPLTDRLDFLGSFEWQRQWTRDGASLLDREFRAGRDSVDFGNPFHGTVETMTGRAQLTYHLDNGDSLISLTGYQASNLDFSGANAPRTYYDPLNASFQSFGVTGFSYRADNPFHATYRQVSQELRYVAESNPRFRWTAGLYAERSEGVRQYSATSTFEPNFLLTGTSATLTSRGATDTTSLAAFADGTLALGERWSVFGGMRVGHDWKDFSYRFRSDNPSFSVLGLDASFTPSYRASLDAGYVTPRIGIQYGVSERFNIYASVSRGYKSGGFNTGFVARGDEGSYKPETLMNYEIGWHARFLNDRLSISGALFYMDWHDQQVQTFNVATQTTPVRNANGSRSYGAELEAEWRPDSHWILGAGFGYADATYTDFPDAVATGSPQRIDASGNRQQFVSRFTGNVRVGYRWDVGVQDLRGSADVQLAMRSGYYFDVANTQYQPGYGLLNARIGVENDRYGIFIWGKNLTNQRYRTSATDFGFGTLVTTGMPLTVGASLRVKF